MLTDALIVNKIFSTKIYTIFMKNIKNHKKKLIAIFFMHKKFLKMYFKPIYLRHLLTFPNVKLGFKTLNMGLSWIKWAE